MSNKTDKPENLLDRQIAQHSRRGLLELDIILGRFLTSRYAALSLEDKQLLRSLLQFSDIDLLNWVTKAQTVSPEYQHLLDQLSECKHSIHDTSS
jgi:succinate dehydrogenase flavin-adding protein (antitoxin of CptAB toxin-antitoxin module)